MSYAQGILKAVAGKSLTAETCSRLIRALDAIPEVFHADFLAAYFKEPDQESEEQPEDYLAVKTFTSSEFHTGDEVKSAYTGERAIILKNSEGGNNSRFYVVFSDGSTGVKEKYDWHRTGRNFPAIPAIMEELKRLDK